MTELRAELKRLHSPDALDLATFRPEHPSDFHILVQAMFGTFGEPGEESFDIVVCSMTWLAREVEKAHVFLPRHHLVMQAYDYEAMRAFIERYGRTISGSSWDEVAQKLGQLGRWEFEGYRDLPS